MSTSDHHREPRRRDRESGQAMVEFALILFPFLALVAGIIQFGIGLNFWLDAQRIANQGARWAAVNCGQNSTPPASYNPCAGGLENTLRQLVLSDGLENSTRISICFPGGRVPGEPVTVKMTVPFTIVPIVGIGSFELDADASMRLELVPEQIPAEVEAEPGAC